MIAYRAPRLFVLATAALSTAALISSPPHVLTALAQTVAGDKAANVQLVVDMGSQRYPVGENPTFTISLRNSGQDNLLLNGGELLGNGAEIWSSIECGFQAGDGRRLPLGLGWGVPGVAGRVYFLGLPLRPGSMYSISVTPRDYDLGKFERLAAGTYELTCTYTGRPSGYRDPTQLPPCWEGVITSNAARVEVVEVNR